MTAILQFIISKVGFIICLSLVALSNVIFVILPLCKIRVLKIGKAFCFCFFTGLSVISLGCLLAFGLPVYKSLLLFGEGLTLYSALFLIKEREREPKELIKEIDKEIAKEKLNNTAIAVENFKPTPKRNIEEKLSLKNKEEPIMKKNELDFSHVKNILERLDYYSLSGGDKKTVNDLENSLTLAEKGDQSSENKSRINDGLGALLKIMSKYGV